MSFKNQPPLLPSVLALAFALSLVGPTTVLSHADEFSLELSAKERRKKLGTPGKQSACPIEGADTFPLWAHIEGKQ